MSKIATYVVPNLEDADTLQIQLEARDWQVEIEGPYDRAKFQLENLPGGSVITAENVYLVFAYK